MIAAIPTQYNGVNFRSRLEAKWAAFFDRCGWGWSYEPFDMNGYIPDFLLHGDSPLLVEVKGEYGHNPYMWDEKVESALLAKAGPDRAYPIMLVGVTPLRIRTPAMPAIGSFLRHGDEDWDLAFLCTSGMHRPYPADRDRQEGVYVRSYHHESHPNHDYIHDCFGGASRGLIADMWSSACNTTQWRKPT